MGKKEQEECLNNLKYNILQDKQKSINDLKCVFSNIDEKIISDILNRSKNNEKPNDFPDFIFDDGFIEHFQVTSSKENKGGSCLIREQKEFEKQNEKNREEHCKKWKNSTFQPGKIECINNEEIYSDVNYDYFYKSFVKNFEEHLKSLSNYKGNSENGIFLIECQDCCLYMNCGVGNVSYCLSLDKNILKFISENQHGLKFILFVTPNQYELIDISKIEDLMQRIPKNIEINNGRSIMSFTDIFIDIF